MNARRTLFTIVGLSAALTGSAIFAAPQAATKQVDTAAPKQTETKPRKGVKIGEKAPNFTLKDTAGKTHTLAQYKGKFVVLQWINPKCPYCVGVTKTGKVARMLAEAKKIDKDVVLLTVNSTHFMEGKDTAAYLKSHKLEAIPGLVDRDGKVGAMYAAKTTPHVFVIDKKGVLRYQGAFDDDQRGAKGEKAMNYAVNALKQISVGETVAPDTVKPYGCSVKYAKK